MNTTMKYLSINCKTHRKNFKFQIDPSKCRTIKFSHLNFGSILLPIGGAIIRKVINFENWFHTRYK